MITDTPELDKSDCSVNFRTPVEEVAASIGSLK